MLMLLIVIFQATVPHAYSSIDCNMENVIQLLNDLEGM